MNFSNNNRLPIETSVRFQVFERDNFTCQYCGRKSPEIILEIDHYVPVSKGGSNHFDNLKTSCRECNEGKSDRELCPIERIKPVEQITPEETKEIVIDNSIYGIENDEIEQVLDLVKEYIGKYELSDFSKKSITELFYRFSKDEITEGIKEAANKYLIPAGNGNPTIDSVDIFIEKIGGVCVYKKKPPKEQRISWTKGIARRRFRDGWRTREGAIVLANYLDTLERIPYTELQILNDFDNRIIPFTKVSTDFDEWKNKIEWWIKNIKIEIGLSE